MAITGATTETGTAQEAQRVPRWLRRSLTECQGRRSGVFC